MDAVAAGGTRAKGIGFVKRRCSMRQRETRSTFTLHTLENLPSGCQHLFNTETEFSLTREWFRNVIKNGLPPNTEARFGALMKDASAIAVIPLRYNDEDGYSSLTNCYSYVYRPLIAPDTSLHEAAWSLGRELGHLNASRPIAWVDCLPSDWPAQEAFAKGLNAGGVAVRKFEQFGNWHEMTHRRSWEEYRASLPGNLRELLRRRSRQATQIGDIVCEIIPGGDELDRGIGAFESVYARSWKPSEPFPQFNVGVIKEAASVGALRLGICWKQRSPIAVQLWVVKSGVGTVLKLAHDEENRSLSPGTLLTAAVIEQLISEGITELDFGRGDDPYKRLWVGQRRSRIGLLLANPRRIGGIAALARHDLGRLLKPLRHRIST
jgi:hypothetical protein